MESRSPDDRPGLSSPSTDRAPRPSQVYRERLGTWAKPVSPKTSASAIWAVCAWIGLVTGLAEGALRLAWRLSGLHVHNPDLWVHWQAPWMAPLATTSLFFGLGLLVSLLHAVLPRTTGLLAPAGLLALGAWGALGAIPGLHPWAVGMLAIGIGAGFGPRLSLEARPTRNRLRRAVLPLLGVWAGFAVATGLVPAMSERWSLATAPRPMGPPPPNVLLVVLDTVRADHLSQHGYGRSTSPRLAARSAQGVRFDQARSTTPYTLGTHASLFTGHWMSNTSARAGAPLDGTHRTLAEHLRDQGYATGGFVGNIFYGSTHYGLNRGFVRYHDSPGNILRRVTPREILRSCGLGSMLLTWFERKARIFAPMQRLRLDGEEVNCEALAWVDAARANGRPFFAFVNYFDAHSPYTLPGHAPQPFSRITADRLEPKMKALEQAEARNEAKPGSVAPAELERLRTEVNGLLRDCYDDGIAWADRQLDELLIGLERRGVLENTLVVITADHGEMLGEHAEIGHGTSLSRPVVHVPLVVLGARGMPVPAGTVVDRPVSVRDVPATILDLIGDRSPNTFPGQSLRSSWSGTPAEERPVLTEMEHLSWRKASPRAPATLGRLWLLTGDRYSYHRRESPPAAVEERLFDLANDPDEHRDLASIPEHRKTLESLRSRFAAARAREFGG